MVLLTREKVCLCTLFLALFLTLLPASTAPLQVGDADLVRVYGRVIDRTTGLPLSDANVVVDWGIYIARTNTSGYYEMDVKGGGPDPLHYRGYSVYVYCDLPSTPGFDYVPADRSIAVGQVPLNVSFALLPGASLYMAGDLRLFGSEPAHTIFTVIDPSGLLEETDSIIRYGEYWRLSYIVGLDGRTVVVPSDMKVRVGVEAYYTDRPKGNFTSDYLTLNQGDRLVVNLRNVVLRSVVDYVNARWQSVQTMVEEAEGVGFYVPYERFRMVRVGNLIESARSSLAEDYYDIAYGDLCEAYLVIEDVEEALERMYPNASWTVLFITPLLGFTAVILVSILYEGWRWRLVVSLALYSVLVVFLYLLFPGYTIIQQNPVYFETLLALLFLPLWPILKYVWGFISSLVELNLHLPLVWGTSFLMALFLIHGLPRLFKEKTSIERLRTMSAVAAAFAIASRNLRRRRLRTLLTSLFMLISVFAFITLTSLSFEYGFTTQPQPGQPPSEGFLLRIPRVGERMPFKPVESEILQWLRERPEVALVAPKIVNTPKVGREEPPPPLAALYAPESGLSFDIRGVLGVFPSLEAKVTKIDGIMVQGQFLSDDDLSGILVSEEAAEGLQVGVNDTLQLYGRDFNVTGIFDSKKLESLKDLDGAPLLPQQVIFYPDPPIFDEEYVPSKEVVILHGEVAQGLPEMVVSRVDVQIQEIDDILSLARLAVLIWPGVETFASVAGKIQHIFIGSYVAVGGFASWSVPMALVALNVGVLMLSAVYERKREVAIMSCVGLNPSHITAVFTAEALIIGVVAGSLGYVLGLTSYRFMTVFLPLGVKQKVEPVWSILALGLSVAAALLGSAIPATKSSIIATPSLLKRWKIRIEEKPKKAGEPWLLSMPLRIRGEELEEFFGFIEKRLKDYTNYRWVNNLRVFRKAGQPMTTRLSFSYVRSEERIATENELSLAKNLLPDRYTIKLTSKTRRRMITSQDESDVHHTADFIRNLILHYSIKGAGKNS